MEIDALQDEIIVKMYANMVYRLAYSQVRNRNDADDIFQEVFLRYFRKNPIFENEEHRKAWLIRVTINCAKKHYLSVWRRKTTSFDDSITFTTPEENSIYEALQQLKPKYRIVIHLFYYEDYSIEQISSTIKIKESTIRTQLTRARQQLGVILKGEI